MPSVFITSPIGVLFFALIKPYNMAFGFNPRYQQKIELLDITLPQFMIIAQDMVNYLGWNSGTKSESSFSARTKMSLSSYGEEINVSVLDGIATIESRCTGNQMMDWGKNRKNVEAFVSAFELLKSGFNAETLEERNAAWQNELAEIKASETAVGSNKKVSFLSLFIPRKGFAVTPILINLNILVFIIMVISGVSFLQPDPQSLIRWGANFRPSTLDGEWYRLITACFLHIGIIHLLMNMYALLYIGILLEPLLGYSRFTLAYLLTGLVSSVVSLWWHDFTVSAGASGAIFGMYGVFFALLLSKIIEPSARKQLLLSVSIFIGYNLLNGMKGGVDNAAHIGGLVSGFLIGLVYIFQLVKPGATSLKKYLSTALVAVVMIAAALVVVRSIPNDVPRYEANMQDFARKERLALEALNMPTTTPYEELVFQLKDRGLYYWDESLELLHKTERLSVPQPLRERTKIFIKYCELRRSSYELMIKSLEERTDKYHEEISNYNEEIKGILVSLNGQ